MVELVIKLPDNLYMHIKNNNVYYLEDGERLYSIIKNGKSLPKGHGRLFDERDIVLGDSKIIGNRIYEIEPIIEADIESEE